MHVSFPAVLDTNPSQEPLPLGLAHYAGQLRERCKSEEGPMADPKHPRHFSDDIKRQIVELINAGKPKSDVMREYDLYKSTVDR